MFSNPKFLYQSAHVSKTPSKNNPDFVFHSEKFCLQLLYQQIPLEEKVPAHLDSRNDQIFVPNLSVELLSSPLVGLVRLSF